jgi:hypothetical protein
MSEATVAVLEAGLLLLKPSETLFTSGSKAVMVDLSIQKPC